MSDSNSIIPIIIDSPVVSLESVPLNQSSAVPTETTSSPSILPKSSSLSPGITTIQTLSPIIPVIPQIDSKLYNAPGTYSPNPISPLIIPASLTIPPFKPPPTVLPSISSIPSRPGSHHSPPPPAHNSFYLNDNHNNNNKPVALPIISSSVASAAASAAYRSNPMSFSSMVSGHGIDQSVGTYQNNNHAVTPLSSSTTPSVPSTSSSKSVCTLNDSNGIKPITNSSGMSASSIQMIPSFRYPTGQGNVTTSNVNTNGKAREYGSPKVVPMATYGSPVVVPAALGSLSGGTGVVTAEKDKVEASTSSTTSTTIVSAPLVATKSERSYPPLPSAFARESPYSTWPSASERDNSLRQPQQQSQQQQSHHLQQDYGHNSNDSTSSVAGDLHKSNSSTPSSAFPYNRTGSLSHRSSASSSSIPHHASPPPLNSSTSAGSGGSGAGTSSSGFIWPGGNGSHNSGAPNSGSRDYAYFNDIARSGEKQRDLQLQQQQQQRERERERERDQQQQQHSHLSQTLPPLPSLPNPKLPISSSSTSTSAAPPSSNSPSNRFSNILPPLSSTPKADPYSNNSQRRYPPVPPSSNPFGDEPSRSDSTGYTPSRSSAANGSARQPVNLPPTTPASINLLSNSNSNSSSDRHKRRRSEGNALHEISSIVGGNLGSSVSGFNNNNNNNNNNSTESIRPSKIQKAPSPLPSSSSSILTAANHLPSIPLPSSSTLPPIVQPPTLPTPPPFTIAQQRLAEIRPLCLKIINEPVLQALEALRTVNSAYTSNSNSNSTSIKDTRPFLGTSIYDPFINPIKMLDGEVLRNGIGGYLEVAINTGWMEGWSFELGDPTLYEGGLIGVATTTPVSNGKGKEVASNSTSTATSTPSTSSKDSNLESTLQNRIPASMWDLEPLASRKVWGTDIYTDDSDILAICLHSGWLRMGSLKGREEAEKARCSVSGKGKERTLLVKLVVGPTLLRYQGCTRQGLKSRSWGNGHDGVSLMIEGITLIENRIKPHGKKWIKFSAGEIANGLAAIKGISNPIHFNRSSLSSTSTPSAPGSIIHSTRPLSIDSTIIASASASTSKLVDVVMAERNLDHVRDTFILDPIKSKGSLFRSNMER